MSTQVNRLAAPSKTRCQMATHCCCLSDSGLPGSRNVAARMSRIRVLSCFSAYMAFQSRTANRTRFASIEMTPEYIYNISIYTLGLLGEGGRGLNTLNSTSPHNNATAKSSTALVSNAL